jgi:hypothetical protein
LPDRSAKALARLAEQFVDADDIELGHDFEERILKALDSSLQLVG